jgi:hypothetical protein
VVPVAKKYRGWAFPLRTRFGIFGTISPLPQASTLTAAPDKAQSEPQSPMECCLGLRSIAHPPYIEDLLLLAVFAGLCALGGVKVVSREPQLTTVALPYSEYSAYLSRIERADERTRTADLVSLRVCGQGLLGVAQDCESRICKRFFSLGCSVLHRIALAVVSDWYQKVVDYTSPVPSSR